jgi:hypothetical protein
MHDVRMSKKERDPRAQSMEAFATFVADLAGMAATYADEIIEWFDDRRKNRKSRKGGAK